MDLDYDKHSHEATAIGQKKLSADVTAKKPSRYFF